MSRKGEPKSIFTPLLHFKYGQRSNVGSVHVLWRLHGEVYERNDE